MQVYIENNIGDKLEHSFDIVREDGSVRLDYSNSYCWSTSHRGEMAGFIVDDGDGIVVKIDDIQKIILNYDQAQRLLILLLDNNDAKIELRHSTVIKKI